MWWGRRRYGKRIVARCPMRWRFTTRSWMDWWGRRLGDSRLGVGHGDLGPWNIMAVDEKPTGFIDWETAGPIDPIWSSPRSRGSMLTSTMTMLRNGSGSAMPRPGPPSRVCRQDGRIRRSQIARTHRAAGTFPFVDVTRSMGLKRHPCMEDVVLVANEERFGAATHRASGRM
jgi:hypothetical protein